MACCCRKVKRYKVSAPCLRRCEVPKHRCLIKEEIKPGPIPKYMGWLYTARDAPEHQLQCGWRPGHISTKVLQRIEAQRGKCGMCRESCLGTCSKPDNLKPCGIPPKCSARASDNQRPNTNDQKENNEGEQPSSSVYYCKAERSNPEADEGQQPNPKSCTCNEPCKSQSCKPAPCESVPCTPAPCKPSSCKPAPCRPAPCKTTPCRPILFRPTPCRPASCRPTPCRPAPCRPLPCRPLACRLDPCRVDPCSDEPCIAEPCCVDEPSAPYLRVIRHGGQYAITTDPPANGPSGPYPLKYVFNCDPNDKDNGVKFSVEAKYNEYCFDYTSSQTSFVLDFSPPDQGYCKPCTKEPCMPAPACIMPC